MCTCFVHAYNYSFVGMYLHSNIHTPNYEHVIHVRIRTHIHAYTYIICGNGGVLIETTTFDRKVLGLNPALAAMKGPCASPSLTIAGSASACKLRHSVNCCGRER